MAAAGGAGGGGGGGKGSKKKKQAETPKVALGLDTISIANCLWRE